jgi:HEAT repeat protein
LRSVPKLISYRQQFRRVIRHGRIAALFSALDAGDAELLRLAIWLMSRIHANIAIPEIVRFTRNADVRVRREAARALRRLEAWAELRAIAQFDPDPRVQRLATGMPAKPFHERFRRFAGTTRATATYHQRHPARPLFVRLPLGPGRPARAPEIIRAILENIRRLVRGH